MASRQSLTCGFCSKNKPAMGFCSNCNGLLCEACVNNHKFVPVLKHHSIKLLDGAGQEEEDVAMCDITEEECPVHPRRLVRFHCELHNATGCEMCMRTTHKACAPAVDLTNISTVKLQSSKLDEMLFNIGHLEKQIETTETQAKTHKKECKETKSICLSDVMKFRKTIEQKLDQLQQGIEIKITNTYGKVEQRLQLVTDMCLEAKRKLEQYRKEIKQLSTTNQNIRTFLATKRTASGLAQLKADIEKTNADSYVESYEFVPNKSMKVAILDTLESFGDVEINVVGSDEISPRDLEVCDSTEKIQSSYQFVTQTDEKKYKSSSCPLCKKSIVVKRHLSCDHVFCERCATQMMKSTQPCKTCGVITGSQPKGQMSVKKHSRLTHKVCYNIDQGTQKAEHPHPGEKYNGFHCEFITAHHELIQLLKLGFKRRLVFRIDENNEVSFNIHHNWTYRLNNVDEIKQKLASYGITPASIDKTEPLTGFLQSGD